MPTSTLRPSSQHQHDWEEAYIKELATPVFKKCRTCPQRIVLNFAGYKRWRIAAVGQDAFAFSAIPKIHKL